MTTEPLLDVLLRQRCGTSLPTRNKSPKKLRHRRGQKLVHGRPELVLRFVLDTVREKEIRDH